MMGNQNNTGVKNIQAPLFNLTRPDLSNVNRQKVFEELEKEPKEYRELFEKASEPQYLYWDKFKYKFPSSNLDSEEKWFLVRQFRNISSSDTPVKSENGEFFKWLRLSSTDEFLHKIDMLAGGQLLPYPNLLSSGRKQTLINRGAIEEAIASSQLEGAHTTRAVAKKMLVEQREPRNESEKMILNNYKTINAIQEDYKNSPLSLDLLLEMHTMLTSGTVDPANQNRFRNENDNIVVQGQIEQDFYTTHIPPSEEFIKNEIQRLINFANDRDEQKFTHPIIKAIWIHFWIGYLHPFYDGNGRMARALFYWYLLRKGYWTFIYLPISSVIKKASTRYAMAYIYSEQDNLDLTYFYDFNIKKIIQSLEDFKDYINRKIEENKEVDKIISQKILLNERQKQLLHYFLSEEKASTSVSSHSLINSVSRQTAAKDLKILQSAGFISPVREGKYIRFYANPDLSNLVR